MLLEKKKKEEKLPGLPTMESGSGRQDRGNRTWPLLRPPRIWCTRNH